MIDSRYCIYLQYASTDRLGAEALAGAQTRYAVHDRNGCPIATLAGVSHG